MKEKIAFFPEGLNATSSSMILILFLALGLVSASLARGNCWNRRTDMPTARWGHIACTVNDKIYVLGGSSSNSYPGFSIGTLEVYDPLLNSWDSTKTLMPTARLMFMAGVVNGKIYAIGGRQNWSSGEDLGTVEMYDPVTDTWETKTPMPYPRTNAGFCVLNDKIYIIGGIKGGVDFLMSNDLQIYNTLTDTWDISKTPMIYDRDPEACVLNNTIYAIGGAEDHSPWGGLNTVETYHTSNDTWTSKAYLCEGRKGFSADVVKGKIYVIGGENKINPVMRVEVYDPIKNIWTSFDQTPIWYTMHASGVIRDRIYLVGGTITGGGSGNFTPTSIMYEYDPHKDLSGFVEYVNVNRSYAFPGADSVIITSKMKDPDRITLFAKIETSEQTPVDILQLFDDGDHNDGDPRDSLFANLWPVPPSEEHKYYIHLQVTRIDTDTIFHEMREMALFTTIGPVTVAQNPYIEGTYSARYRVQNLQVVLQNTGNTKTATNLAVQLSTDDIRVAELWEPVYVADIAAGAEQICDVSAFKYAEGYDPDSTIDNPIHFEVTISSSSYHLWTSSFEYAKVDPSSITNSNSAYSQQYGLYQNYPNPFNPITNIKYRISNAEFVTLKIYNLCGQEITTLVSQEQKTGHYQVKWDASGFASGVYLYKLSTGSGFEQSRKLLFIK
jgi:N-acetylneuraminic acid mutarotase